VSKTITFPASIQYLSLIIAASLYSDKGKFNSDLNAARNVNMSEYALNQSSLRMTLNHPFCRELAFRMETLVWLVGAALFGRRIDLSTSIPDSQTWPC
jgi:hypothetical protein